MPERITLSRAKGWKMPLNTVKVDRSTRWGNPFRPGFECLGREPIDACGAVGMFRDMLADEALRDWVDYPCDADIRANLRGKNLACWCKPGTPCHADVLMEIANG